MSTKEFDMFVDQANRLASQGKLEDAVDMYQRALAIEPYDAGVRHQVINIYIRTGEFESAVSEYLTWAKVCQDKGLVDDALAVYQELISLENQVTKKSFAMGRSGSVGDVIRDLVSSVRVDVFYNVGVLLQAKGVIDDSIEYLKVCLQLSPPESSARVHMVLGQAYMKKGMDKEAVGEFQEVVRLAPMDAAYAYEMLGEIYIRGGRTPQGTIVWFKNASDLYLKNNQVQDAVRVFERILAFDPRNKEVLGSLGDIYSQRGQADKAVEVSLRLAGIYADEGLLDKVVGIYEKLIELVPENVSIRKRLIDIYREILNDDPGNLPARHKLISLLLNDGSSEQAIPEFLKLASAYLDKKMYQEGISVCQRMLDIDPENLEANKILGEIYYNQGDSDFALDQYLRLVKLHRDKGDEESANKLNQELYKKFPQQIEVCYRQAIEEKEKGNYDSALNLLNDIIKDNPSYKQAIFARADILAKQDKWDEALEGYRKVLSIDPNYIEARRILLDRYLADGNLDEALSETMIMASVIFTKGDYRETESLYRRMLTYFPDNPDLREKICAVQAARGHIEKAVSGYLMIFEIYRRSGDVEHAMAMCRRILELAPENLFAKRKLADLCRESDPQGAVKLYSEISAMYVDKRLDAAAAEIMQTILSIDPSENEVRQELIKVYIKQLKFKEATENYRFLLMDYLENGDVARAQETVKEIIALQPFNLEMREELGEIYVNHDMVTEAMGIFEELIHHYEENNDLDKVISVMLKLEELAARRQNSPLAWDYSLKAADLYCEQEKWDEASEKRLATLRQMIEHEEEERVPEVFDKIVETYERQDRVSEGIEKLDEIARGFIDSGNVEKSLDLLEQIEGVHYRLRDYEKALEVLGFLSSQYEELGNISESIRQREAMSEIYKSLDVNGSRTADIIDNYFAMIDLVLKQDLPAKACEYYSEIENWRKDDMGDLLRIAQTLFSAGFMQESLPYFERLLAIDKESCEAMSRLAIIHASNSDYDQCIVYATKILTRGLISSVIKAYRELVFKNSSEGEAHMNLGKFYESMGFSEEAVGEYRAASDFEDTRIEALNHIGSIFLSQHFYNLAIKHFQSILDEESYDEDRQQDTRYSLAQAYYALGNYEEALNMYQECYAVDICYRDVEKKIMELSELVE